MQRGRALVLDRRRLLLEHGDRHAAPVERQRAHHPDRPRADDDNARVCLRRRHAVNLTVYCGFRLSSRTISAPLLGIGGDDLGELVRRAEQRVQVRLSAADRQNSGSLPGRDQFSRHRVDDVLRRARRPEQPVVGDHRRAS